MVQFGGIFLPVHFLGLLGEGEIPSGPVGLNYQVGLGNGRNANIARAEIRAISIAGERG